MEKGFLKNRMVRMLFVLTAVFSMLVLVKKDTAYAADTTKVNLQTLKKNTTYKLDEIEGLKSTSVVTITTSDADVVELSYRYKKTGNSYYTYDETDSLVLTGKNLKNKAGNKVSNIKLEAVRAGKATVTVEVDTNGEITTKEYRVTVKGCKAVCGKLSKKTIKTIEETGILLENITPYAKVSISANKNKAFLVRVDNEKEDKIKKVYVNKKAKTINLPSNEIEISPKKPGTYRFTVRVEQDGKVTKRKYTLKVTKYENPIQYFIGSVKPVMKKSPPFSVGLTDYILLTETPSRLNFTGFQPGLDWVSEVKIGLIKPKERGGKGFLALKPSNIKGLERF